MKARFILPLLLVALASSARAQSASYYLPPGVTNIRAMIVGGTPLAGGTSQIWRDFCAAQRVGLAQSLSDLPAIAAASGHPEMVNAPFATCGTSAGASAASTAIANPARGIAVVGLHGAMMALGNDGFNANRSGENGDVATLDFSGAYGVPMIHNFDNNDGFVNPVMLQGLVEFGRAHGAPWTFFIHNDGNHTDNNTALTTLIFPWLAAVFDARLPASAGTGDGTATLNAIVETNGWLGDIKTRAIASYAAYAGDRTKADWFPNQAVATIWSGYHLIPPYSIPPQPIVAPGGIIADLTILDPANHDTSSGTGWKINANFKEADQAGSLWKYFIMAPPPASVAGLDWIRPITPGKTYSAYTADPIFTFRVTADATVFIAHSDQGTSRPAWLATWTNTSEQLVVTSGNLNSNAPRYTLFKKDFSANAIVSCGANGTPPSGQMYLTFVKPLGAQALASVSVGASDASATEGGDTGAFTITRTGATTNELTVNFSVSGTATSGGDFLSLGTSVSLPAGQSSATVTVTLVNDAEIETTETIVLTLVTNAAYNLGSPASATVNLLDDDAPPLPVVTVADTLSTAAEPGTAGQFTITRTGATTNALTVNFTVGGSATAGADYTSLGTNAVLPIGQSSVALAVAPLDDLLVEGTETVTLALSSSPSYTLGVISVASVNLTDNDTSSLPIVTIVATDADAGEPGNGGSWIFTRAGATAGALTVSFALTGTATRASDYTVVAPPIGSTVIIAAGQTSVALNLSVVNDAIVEPVETVVCTINTSASYTVGAASSATIFISDDDGGASTNTLPVVTITATDANAGETNADTGTFTFARTGPATNALTVQFTVSGTATSGADYVALGTNATFALGQSNATLTVTPLDDALVEGLETVIVTLSANAAYTPGLPSSATVTISDDESGGGGTLIFTNQIFATYVTGQNTRNVMLDLYLPASGPGPYPVFLWLPGGGWSIQNKNSIIPALTNLTSLGYAVVSANYSSSSNVKWPAQIWDAKAAVRWLRGNAAQFNLDPTRIAAAGNSSGGHLAAFLGTSGGTRNVIVGGATVDIEGALGTNVNLSSRVQCALPFFPPTDLLVMDHYFTPGVMDHNAANSPESGLMGAAIQTIPEKTATANPMLFVGSNAIPFFITQGTADALVPFNQSELLNAALVRAGNTPVFWPVFGGGHGPGVLDSPEVILLITKFLDRVFRAQTNNAPPVASFTMSATNGIAPLTVSFNGGASTDPDGSVTKYQWSFGDDTGTNVAAPAHTFTVPGVYPVALAVRDAEGASASVTKFITVQPSGGLPGNVAPTVSITNPPPSGTLLAAPGKIHLQATAADSDGTVTNVEFFVNGASLLWDTTPPYAATFNDLAPGSYTAFARATDAAGATTTSAPVTFRVLAAHETEPRASVTIGQFTFTHARFGDGSVSYALDVSTNLTTWMPSALPVALFSTNGPVWQARYTEPQPVTNSNRKFFRVNTAPVTLP